MLCSVLACSASSHPFLVSPGSYCRPIRLSGHCPHRAGGYDVGHAHVLKREANLLRETRSTGRLRGLSGVPSLHVCAAARPSMRPEQKATLTGQGLILYSALTCASTPVALRYLYLQDQPPAAPVLAAVQTSFAAVILVLISGAINLWQQRRGQTASDLETSSEEGDEWRVEQTKQEEREDKAGVRRRLLDPSPPLSRADRAGSDFFERGGSTFSLDSFDGVHDKRASKSGAVSSIQKFGAAVRRPLAGVLNSKARNMTWAGAELGMLAFFANAIMIYGFTFTTIAKGAFLIRASIIFTPILCTIAGEAVPVGLWVGALTGFAGSIMISLDPSKAEDASASAATGPFGFQPEIWGDLVLVASAGFWSLVMVRQSRHAPDYPSFPLGTYKVVTMAVLSVCWLIAAGIVEVEQSAPLTDLWQGYGDPLAWLVLLWPALGQYSTGEAAQVAGQAKISAAAGQVILAMDPVISIALGFLVNRDETRLGPLGIAGGATLLGACLLASFYAKKEH